MYIFAYNAINIYVTRTFPHYDLRGRGSLGT